MFVQKLKLRNVSYSTSENLETLLESLFLEYNIVVILTPFSSKSDSTQLIEKKLMEEKQTITVTPNEFKNLKMTENICPHVLVPDYKVMGAFGYIISEIGAPFIVFNEQNFIKIFLSKFFINKTKHEAFTAIYMLSQLFDGTLVVELESLKKRLEIFLQVMGIQWDIKMINEVFGCPSSIIFFECYNEKCLNDSTERVFVIGKSNFNDFDLLEIDTSLTGQYKHRIEELYDAITPNVISGKKEFNWEKFKDLKTE